MEEKQNDEKKLKLTADEAVENLQEFERSWKMKKLGIVLGTVFVIVVWPFVVQYGWNEIITTIVPVGKNYSMASIRNRCATIFYFPCIIQQKRIL